MYIIKNALKCIGRSKGRNILIGLIVFVIALSSCIGLSIRQAAESAKRETLASMSITATIAFDRSAVMSQITGGTDTGSGRSFDKNSFADIMGASSSLSLEEYQTYAAAPSVKDFYYSMTTYVNGTDSFAPVSAVSETEENAETVQITDGLNLQNGKAGGKGNKIFGSNSDFTLIGYSEENAMTSFLDGTAAISQGTVFATDSANYECIITEELAAFNSLSVGDLIQISNPNNAEELYTLKVVGIYTDFSANESSFSMFGATSSDPANKIAVNYATLQEIIAASETATAALTGQDSTSTAAALNGTLAGTYVFASIEEYEAFEQEVRSLGLNESYSVTSSDVSAYEKSMAPLNTLSTMAGYFLLVILFIGAIILIVLNIFNIRERKYEIGVLTAMGMKKGKVALQFLTEIFVVTSIAVIVGVSIGALSSVPVTNKLLENQIAAQNSQSEQTAQNFGRGSISADRGSAAGGKGNFFTNILGTNSDTAYVTEVSSAVNLTVVIQMLGIGILLTLISGTVSMLFVMRYEPLKILANRD